MENLYFYDERKGKYGIFISDSNSRKMGNKQRRIRVLCAEGRIEGAYKVGAVDVEVLRKTISGRPERIMETEFNFDVTDDMTGLKEKEQIVRIRKLNKKIGDNLKRLDGYRCQVCGRLIGEEYGSHVVETHHIDYFVNSLNNDASNQIIVCLNHHSIIHDENPVFDRKRLIYIYKKGLEEKLMLNQHL
jgi:5-methylcytosine-specific restriction endonuclease McrA